jgi:hypothetical protein
LHICKNGAILIVSFFGGEVLGKKKRQDKIWIILAQKELEKSMCRKKGHGMFSLDRKGMAFLFSDRQCLILIRNQLKKLILSYQNSTVTRLDAAVFFIFPIF